MKQKLLTFFGVCGCLSCYAAMFPVLFIGLFGVLGISSISILGITTTYQHSVLFLPIFIISLAFLLLPILPYGKTAIFLAVVGCIGIYASMTFYMQQWLFTISFALVTISYFLAYHKTKSMSLKLSIFLLLLIVLLGVVDTGRLYLVRQSAESVPSGGTMNQMMK